ncbi:MAG: DUF3558 family protein [Candidatus Limnocylindrales bacterium]
MRLSNAALAALVIVSISACGGGTPAPTGNAVPTAGQATTSPTVAPSVGTTPAPVGGTTDVCSLLTAAELNAATGKSNYAAGVEDTIGGCVWNLEGLSNNQGDVVYGAFQTLDLSVVKASFGSGGSDATVNGHPAFWNPSAGLGSMWVDIGGGPLFVLSFPQAGNLDPSYTQIAQQLAEIAVGRL